MSVYTAVLSNFILHVDRFSRLADTICTVYKSFPTEISDQLWNFSREKKTYVSTSFSNHLPLYRRKEWLFSFENEKLWRVIFFFPCLCNAIHKAHKPYFDNKGDKLWLENVQSISRKELRYTDYSRSKDKFSIDL